MSMALIAMDATIIATAVPQVVGDLGGMALLGWVFSSYLLGQTVTIPIYGKFADVYGRKPIILTGAVIFLVGSALCAVAWDMPSLILFRALQGIGGGGIGATVSTIAADLYNVRERGRVQGYLSTVWGVAGVAGPTLGGAFAEYSSWRWIFLINLPIGAVALTLIVRYLHETVERHEHRIDYAGAVGVLLTAGTLIFALLETGTAWPLISYPTAVTLALVVVFAAVTLRIERRAAEPIVDPRIWSRRVLVGANLGSIALGMMIIGPAPFLPTYGQFVLGLNAILAGLLLASTSLTWPIAASQSPRSYLRIGFRDTSLIGVALCLAGSMIFWLQPTPGTAPWTIGAMVTMGAGFGLLSTSLLVGAQSTVEWGERGAVTGAVMFSRFLGQSIGAAVFGAIANLSIRSQLGDAPASLADDLPHHVDGITATLSNPNVRPAVADYARDALEVATHHVYLGISCCALACAILLLLVMPRRFRMASSAAAAVEPADEPAASDSDPA